MLIRHITIPPGSTPIPFNPNKGRSGPYQLNDDSNHFARTLNPKHPDSDMLVSFKCQGQNAKNGATEANGGFIRRSSSVLASETPQNVQDFTDSSLPKQLKMWSLNQNKERRVRSSFILQKGQKLDIINFKHRQLQNNYMQILGQKREYNLTSNVDSPYLNKEQLVSEEEDSGIVNRHTKSSIVHGQIYRTLEKIQARTQKRQSINHINPLPHKKYSYSLPKSSIAPKTPQNGEEVLNQPNKNIQQQLARDSINQNPEVEKLRGNKSLLDNRRKARALEEKQSALREVDAFDIRKNQVPKTSQRIDVAKQIRAKNISPIGQMSAPLQRIEISYKTSLSELKNICNLRRLDQKTLVMKIPEIFSRPLFTGHQEPTKLFQKSEAVLSELKIPHKKDFSIKKYNNCVLILSNYTAIVWHYTGKVYFGGWKYQMLDQGHKNGLGLQWFPIKHVYYGQFCNGKRHGVGIMKNSSNEVIAGLWHENKYVRSLARQHSYLSSHFF